MCGSRGSEPGLARRFHTKIDQLRRGIDLTRHALLKRVASGKYPVTGLFDDLHLLDFVEPFVAFLEINKATFTGQLRLARAILTYAEILHERDVGKLEVPPSVLPAVNGMAVGSIDYFMRVSHSVSRDDLYDEVRAALLEQLLPARMKAR